MNPNLKIELENTTSSSIDFTVIGRDEAVVNVYYATREGRTVVANILADEIAATPESDRATLIAKRIEEAFAEVAPTPAPKASKRAKKAE